MAPTTFTCNIAFTFPANTPSVSTPLTARELWQGIKRGACHPDDFADYVASCTILPGSREKFRRRLTLGEGAVHTAPGGEIVQEVSIVERLHVRVCPCHCPPPSPPTELLPWLATFYRDSTFNHLLIPSVPLTGPSDDHGHGV